MESVYSACFCIFGSSGARGKGEVDETKPLASNSPHGNDMSNDSSCGVHRMGRVGG